MSANTHHVDDTTESANLEFRPHLNPKSELYDRISQTTSLPRDKKIISSAHLELASEDPDSTLLQVEALAKSLGGYVQATSWDRVVMRIPKESIHAAIHAISNMAKLTDKKLNGKDVTSSYTDLQIRLQNALRARDRYLELLDVAEDVKSALLVEKELERLNGEINRLKGRLNKMDHLSTYATVTTRVKQLKKPGPLGYVGLGFYRATRWLFVRG